MSRTVKSAVPDSQALAGVFCRVDRALGLSLEAGDCSRVHSHPEWTLFAIPSTTTGNHSNRRVHATASALRFQGWR